MSKKTDNYNVQKENRQKDKKYSIKRYTENWGFSNMNLIKH
jgi:hypothetical protein